MNRSNRGRSVKRLERSNKLDTALYKNIHLLSLLCLCCRPLPPRRIADVYRYVYKVRRRLWAARTPLSPTPKPSPGVVPSDARREEDEHREDERTESVEWEERIGKKNKPAMIAFEVSISLKRSSH